jgi:hypothetical protein
MMKDYRCPSFRGVRSTNPKSRNRQPKRRQLASESRTISCAGFTNIGPRPFQVLRQNTISHGWFGSKYDDPVSAIARDEKLKKWKRNGKTQWIEVENPEWNDLYEPVCIQSVIPGCPKREPGLSRFRA